MELLDFRNALNFAITCMEVRFIDLKNRRVEMLRCLKVGVPGSAECVDLYDKELRNIALSIIEIYKHMGYCEVCYEEYLKYLANTVE